MTAPLKILMPLRVPELGPSLGRLIVPHRRSPPWVPLDDLREELATRVIELAGEARAAAERGDREAVLEALGRRVWLAAWEQASRAVAGRVADAVDTRLEREGRSVRMPRWRRRRLKLTAPERRAVAGRMASSGARLVTGLDALEEAATRVRAASVLDRDVLERWQEALRAAARRLEAAWLALEEAVEEEARRWTPEFEQVSHWRPSLWPVVVVWLPLAAVLLWLGLLFGGYLPAPAWLAERLGF